MLWIPTARAAKLVKHPRGLWLSAADTTCRRGLLTILHTEPGIDFGSLRMHHAACSEVAHFLGAESHMTSNGRSSRFIWVTN